MIFQDFCSRKPNFQAKNNDLGLLKDGNVQYKLHSTCTEQLGFLADLIKQLINEIVSEHESNFLSTKFIF